MLQIGSGRIQMKLLNTHKQTPIDVSEGEYGAVWANHWKQAFLHKNANNWTILHEFGMVYEWENVHFSGVKKVHLAEKKTLNIQ